MRSHTAERWDRDDGRVRSPARRSSRDLDLRHGERIAREPYGSRYQDARSNRVDDRGDRDQRRGSEGRRDRSESDVRQARENQRAPDRDRPVDREHRDRRRSDEEERRRHVHHDAIYDRGRDFATDKPDIEVGYDFERHDARQDFDRCIESVQPEDRARYTIELDFNEISFVLGKVCAAATVLQSLLCVKANLLDCFLGVTEWRDKAEDCNSFQCTAGCDRRGCCRYIWSRRKLRASPRICRVYP